MTNDEFLMMRCIDLAGKGAGSVSPNPLVGCIIVKNGKIISEGYHKKFGDAHAEVNAINKALSKNISLKGAAIYVNLEPCFHYGKTPPCVEKIIEHRFSKVVIGIKDPNPLVSGKSIRKLKQNGIEVITGILANQCRQLNKFFIKHITKRKPYILLKAAQTLDGKIARINYDSKWISSQESRKMVHKLRSEYDAVLVGKNTVKYDDPKLTVRHVKGRNPFRIVIDRNLTLKPGSKIFTDQFSYKTIILTGKIKNKNKAKKFLEGSVRVLSCKINNGLLNLNDALRKLGKMGITSIMVEGGAETFLHFLKQKHADEVMIFVSPKVFGSGITAFKEGFDFSVNIRSVQKVGSDVLFQFQLKEI